MEKIIVEIGANSGTDTIRFLQENADVTVYAFEPTHELLIKYLWPLAEQYSQLKVMPFAVDIKNDFKFFKVAGHKWGSPEYGEWGCSSLYDFADSIQSKWENRPDFNMTHQYTVPSITMYDFCKMYNITKIDYIHIDTQGNDFNCLLSFKEYINIVKSGKCEVAAKTELYKGTNNIYKNVRNWLIEKGFNVTDLGDVFNDHEIDLFFTK